MRLAPRPALAAALALAACHPPWPGDSVDDTGASGHRPTIAFVQPAEDGSAWWAGATGTFELSASDPDGDLAHVELASDPQGGLGWAADLGDVWAFDASLQPGAHRVTGTAVDIAGHRATDEVSATSRTCDDFAGELICRWTFDASATPLEEEPNANGSWPCTGSVREGTRASSVPLVEGVYGLAPDLAGDGHLLQATLPADLGASAWTLLVWFRGGEACPTSDGGYPLLALVNPKGADVGSIAYTTTAVEIDRAGSIDATATTAIGDRWDDGAWHLLALQGTADGYLRSYLDGSKSAFYVRYFSPPVTFDGATLLLGAAPSSSTTWCGAVDDLAVSLTPLSQVDLAWTWGALTPFCLGTL